MTEPTHMGHLLDRYGSRLNCHKVYIEGKMTIAESRIMEEVMLTTPLLFTALALNVLDKLNLDQSGPHYVMPDGTKTQSPETQSHESLDSATVIREVNSVPPRDY